VYQRTDDEGVLWQIRWETKEHLDWGSILLGKQAGLVGVGKWILTSVHGKDNFESGDRREVPRYYSVAHATELTAPDHGWVPRNSSNTDFDCAAGSMMTQGASKYWVGPANSNSCMDGYVFTGDIASCRNVSDSLGLKWASASWEHDFPQGCYIYEYPPQHYSVYFNEGLRGAPDPSSHIVCARNATI
jgi:hypothetical protein